MEITKYQAVQPVRLIIQERRGLLRAGLAAIVRAECESVSIAGLVADGPALLELARRQAPDLVILELHPSGWDVAAVVHELRRLVPSCRIAALHEGRRYDQAQIARRLDVDLLPYGAGTAALLALLDSGEPLSLMTPTRERRLSPSRLALTNRERDVLRHVAAGLTTQESAQLLEVSPKTVDNHKQRIFSKFGVQNQAHAVAVAYRIGVLTPDVVEDAG